MNHIVIITAALLGALAIILGAFGAHAFKKILSAEKLDSFEVGVRYQMYAAITLLVLGLNLSFDYQSERVAYYLITSGTLLFSGSIYFLSFAEYWKKNLKFLGPITPLGGLLMIMGWIAIIIRFL
ncbi:MULTISPECIES: DUF423 domain-containing protein [Sphingobacterium]|uniref:DUF423 domain-containing protein n=1 Tax=Sphingobacterium athyrii TaxID=2152717 RepID=A0A363NYR6_9SPHI|nr:MULTISPECIES: DUF423 domain-containing protein [Sphingobacterium]PUV25952.1 DUF423 domain-containing protein [Sphingobacterium athyrii]QIH33176.1 DUF423 domain-containing protein [Sphingobacterium sp. DR205]